MGLPRFAVVDVETSGLSSTRHRILQIGIVTVEPDGAVSDSWSSLVRLPWPWSRIGPRRIHGLTRRTLRGAPHATQVMAEVGRRLDGAVFAAHNADFDAEFLTRAARRAGIALDLDRRVCTLELSRRLDPDRRLTHGLADVCARYGVALDRPHDALCDAAATAAVLPHLLAANRVADLTDLESAYPSYRASTR